MQAPQSPQLFEYTDYRHYLRDYYLYRKQQKGAAFSYRSLAKQVGFKSPNFLKLVIEGTRNLSAESIERLVPVLKLNKGETQFFTHLVHFNQAKTLAERNQWYQRLASSKRYREIKAIEHDRFAYFSHWSYAAIRELVLLPDFIEDAAWIAQKLAPRITVQAAQEAIDLLLRLGFLVRNEDGRLVQADRTLETDREVLSLAVSNFHRQMLRRAHESIEKTPAAKRDISSLTVAVSRKKFLEAKRRIQEFRRELNLLLSNDDDVDAVYQINFQLFNLTELPW